MLPSVHLFDLGCLMSGTGPRVEGLLSDRLVRKAELQQAKTLQTFGYDGIIGETYD